ncbi:MupA/Atu3671 family FMN-dependent luciferase-like monooxygenase [Sandaracinus amylolyticus]|uniref:MupA/Atu3671 family FMN-dependent luciferase-like monooxygenase n=1 Tax=Sandaracinus amylolyticus TaxID=927083 RepID=UPI001F19F395|nr:MupA/Atu3671 family FMN-dependent luciferase-like monooxygenase [Sandaracinus amylolyticus]UJR80259.1 LLM class flavin-dependent oxidoreductase [Sandaracinus amylolyticus]
MSSPFRCYVIGNESLAIQCADILRARGHAVLGIVSSDEGIGKWADQNGVARIAPGKGLAERLRAHTESIGGGEFDWLFSIANLTIIPDDVLAMPKRGSINFHDGPLPRYAGLNAPMWAILNAEPRHGISWHVIEGGVDEGDILAQRTFGIGERDTSVVLNTRCYEAAIESFSELVDQLGTGTEQRTKQDLSQRTYFGRYDRPAAMCTIDWAQPASKIAALIRALDFGPRYANPVGAAKTQTSTDPLLLPEVIEGSAEASDEPGTIVAIEHGAIEVATGQGTLRFPRATCVSGIPQDDAALAKHGIVKGARLPALEETRAARLGEADQQLAKHETFWAKRLAQVAPIELPYADRTPSKAPVFVRAPVPVPAGMDAASTLAAAIAWLARITGNRTFDVGYRHGAITSATQGVERFFAQSVPLRVELGDSVTFAELREKIAADRERLREHLTFPRDLVARTPGLGAAKIEIAVEETDALDTVKPRAGEVLEIAISPDGSRATLIIDSTRVAAAHLEKMVGRFGTLLQGAASDAATQVARLPLLPADELDRVLRQWNATTTDYPADRSVHQLFEAQVDRTPDAIALAFERERLTYRALDERANQLAHKLIALGVGRDTLVALHVDRSPELVIGALAIWKAGGAYVPVDPSYPADRVALYVEDSQAKVVLTKEHLAHALPQTGATILRLDADASSFVSEPRTRPARETDSASLAYVIYTSGSTGRPKGVMIEHRHVANFFTGMDPVIPRPTDARWLAVTSLSFDISVLELFWTLCRGFEVVLSSDEDRALVSSGRAPGSDRKIGFSLFYFASDEGEKNAGKYRLLLEGAKLADRNGFQAVWTPERHFGAFGGLYPNPSVASAAIAAVTQHVKIRSGSCVLPLHHPIRVAEEWALVDNLSNGRVGISFASGWHPNDFVLRPENFANAKGAMVRDIEIVRKLWRGETLEFEGPKGPVKVKTLPRPVQPELPVWVTAAGNPETFAAAGRMGAGILTHLLGQSLDEVREKVAVYRKAWKDSGHEGEGHVTLMLHTFIGDDERAVKETAREPMKDYLRSSMNLIAAHAWAFPAFKKHAKEGATFEDNFTSLSQEDADALLDHAFERYYETSGLFGTPESALQRVNECKAIGVDEIACLIDYGIDSDTVLAHLDHLNRLRLAAEPKPRVDEDDWSIAAQIVRHRITHLQCTPSMLRMLLGNDEARTALAHVKHMFVGGEALPGSLVAELAQATRATLTNMYGPTETTIWSSTEVAAPVEGTVSIGKPIANTQLYVLDAARQPVPVGAPGELWIGGAGVARGYWQRPDLTEERFVPDPFVKIEGARMYRTGDLVRWAGDGRVEFLGRVDHQVKIRGYRIELGEIESRLSNHEDVREVVVVAREDNPGDKRLVAYYTAAQGHTPDPEKLRAHLRVTLPEFMVPSHFVELARFPLTPNNKIDRKQLPKPDESAGRASAAEFVAAESEIEKQIAAIWMRILGLSKVGTQDNFFELGGHSLLAVQAHREIKQATGKDLTITDIFRFPTIAALASYLGGGGDAGGGAEELGKTADRAAQRREMMNRRNQVRRR